MFSWINNLGSWLNDTFNWLDSIWVWMTPGAHALAKLAPIGVPLMAFFATVYAVRTFRLRARVDHAEHWLKRFHEGVEKSLSSDEIEQKYGTELLTTLNPPKRPWIFFNSDKTYNRRIKQISIAYRRTYNWVRWKIGWLVIPFLLLAWSLKWVAFGHSIRASWDFSSSRRDQFIREYKRMKMIRKRAKAAGLKSKSGSPSERELELFSPTHDFMYPTFRERLKSYRRYRKLRKVRWVVSPEEVDAHKAISDLLRARIIGADSDDQPPIRRLLLPEDE